MQQKIKRVLVFENPLVTQSDYNFLDQMFSVKSIELSFDVCSLKQMQHSKREK